MTTATVPGIVPTRPSVPASVVPAPRSRLSSDAAPRSNGTHATLPATRVSFAPIPDAVGHRIAVYGSGGVGKSSLACLAPGPVAFFDLEESLPRLRPQWLAQDLKLDIRTVPGVQTWQDLRAALHAPGWEGIQTIVLDTLTRCEEMAVRHTLDTVTTDKGQKVSRLADYPYGKGTEYLYDTFLALLGDLDQHVRAGRHVVLVCHECTTSVPNPQGEDWLRYEPRLSSPTSGKNSIRLRVKEWVDHLLFIGFDVDVKDRKGKGSGTRTIYPVEQPHCMAKSRTLADTVIYERHDRTLWNLLIAPGSHGGNGDTPPTAAAAV